MNGNAINGLLDPISKMDAANKNYVDNSIQNLPSGGSENLNLNTLSLNYLQNNGNNNGVIFYDKTVNNYPLFNVGFSNLSSTDFQVFASNELTVGCNQNYIEYQQGDNGQGGSLNITSKNTINFKGYSGKQNIDIKQATIEDLPTQDNEIATKKYVDDNTTEQKNYTQVIYGPNQAFRQTTRIPKQSTDIELLKFKFSNGEALPTGNKYFLSVNIPCFLITNFTFGQIGVKVNGGTTSTIFETSTLNNANQGTLPEALNFGSLIQNATFPLIISVVASNNSSQGSIYTSVYISRDDAIVSCKIEAVKTGSTGI